MEQLTERMIMEREEGYYWIKTPWWGPEPRWETAYFEPLGTWLGDRKIDDASIYEWGPRIYPPDHVFKEEVQAYDYDERRLPESN